VVCTLPYGKIIDEEILEENVEFSPSEGKRTAPYLTYIVRMRVQVAKQQGKADPFFRVEAKINRSVFKEGDHIEHRITPTKDAYISVFNILKDETVRILIPNRLRQNNFVKGGGKDG